MIAGKEEFEKDFRKCEEYYQPAILLNSNFNIIYKNRAAKIVNIKPRVGINIKQYMDSANIEKLCGAAEKEEFKILKLDIYSPIKRCVTQPDGKSVTALVFYDALNLLKESGANENELINKIEDIILKYNKRRKAAIKPAGDNSPFYENSKKMIKINEHFRKHMINLTPRGADEYKSYCEIRVFLNNFAAGISQYVNSFGYKIGCNIEDKMFYYWLNEDDLQLINFILSTTALKYSVFNKVDMTFFSDFYGEGILRYEFKTAKDFLESHQNMFVKNYLNEIKDIEYLDMNLAALVAKNNGLKLNVYFDPNEDGRVCFDLIFGVKETELDSPRPDGQINYITAEKIKEKADIEFAGIFDGNNI